MKKPRVRIHPYKQGSRSAKVLADALGGKVLKLEGSKFKPKPSDVIINWGSSKAERPWDHSVLNNPYTVHVASDKLQAFVRLKNEGVSIPSFATSRDSVNWEGLTVCRHKLTGHSGEGIELADASNLPAAPLYVQYIPKKHEFRVHVVGESIIAVQRKARRPDVENPDWKVRNHANGFIFAREGFTAPSAVLEESRRAIAALGLDFGAVDVIWNEKQRKAFVLEVNTAPGLEGRTVNDYAEGFKQIINPRNSGNT